MKAAGQLWEARIRFEAPSWGAASRRVASLRRVVKGMFKVMGLRYAMHVRRAGGR